jgi:hypothetical protein
VIVASARHSVDARHEMLRASAMVAALLPCAFALGSVLEMHGCRVPQTALFIPGPARGLRGRPGPASMTNCRRNRGGRGVHSLVGSTPLGPIGDGSVDQPPQPVSPQSPTSKRQTTPGSAPCHQTPSCAAALAQMCVSRSALASARGPWCNLLRPTGCGRQARSMLEQTRPQRRGAAGARHRPPRTPQRRTHCAHRSLHPAAAALPHLGPPTTPRRHVVGPPPAPLRADARPTAAQLAEPQAVDQRARSDG